jgi:dUTP pyrophosphatase
VPSRKSRTSNRTPRNTGTRLLTIHRLSPAPPLPQYQTPGSAGFDLASSSDLVVGPGEIALVPTGLVMAVPAGHFLGVFARSSTPLKRGLIVANGVGVVDADYCGPADEIKIQVMNVTAQPVSIARGDRLAQGVVIPYVRAEWHEATPDRPSRGGFGSTGAGHVLEKKRIRR